MGLFPLSWACCTHFHTYFTHSNFTSLARTYLRVCVPNRHKNSCPNPHLLLLLARLWGVMWMCSLCKVFYGSWNKYFYVWTYSTILYLCSSQEFRFFISFYSTFFICCAFQNSTYIHTFFDFSFLSFHVNWLLVTMFAMQKGNLFVYQKKKV